MPLRKSWLIWTHSFRPPDSNFSPFGSIESSHLVFLNRNQPARLPDPTHKNALCHSPSAMTILDPSHPFASLTAFSQAATSSGTATPGLAACTVLQVLRAKSAIYSR
jgi:hypothetical protein